MPVLGKRLCAYLLRNMRTDLRDQAKTLAKRDGYTLRMVLIQFLEGYVKRGKDT